MNLAPGQSAMTADEYVAAIQKQRIAGDDAIVLHALASKRLGTKAWDVFRASARDLLGSQRLDGNVVVLANRLAGARLPLVTTR